MHPGDLLRRESLLQQPIPPRFLGLPRADRTDVGGGRAQGDTKRRLVELGIVREDADVAGRVETDPLEGLLRPRQNELVGLGKPLAREPCLPSVGDNRSVAELFRQGHQRHRDVHAAEDHQLRLTREHLEERRSVPLRRLQRDGCAPLVPECVERGVPESVHRQTMGWRPIDVAIGGYPDRASGLGTVDDGGQHLSTRPARRREHVGTHCRFHQDLDGPPAGEPDLPRFLVAHAEGHELRAAPVDRLGDLRRRGGLHTAAGYRAGHRSVPGRQHAGALRSRSGAPHTGDHRPADWRSVGAESLVIRDQLTHGSNAIHQGGAFYRA